MTADKQTPPEKQRARSKQGQSEKFAWIKAAGADPNLSDSAFRVLALCAIHDAGSKGYWTGKRVHLAQLCGVSVQKFDRAIAEGIKRNWIYTHTDAEDRRARQYHIVTVEERDEAEREREREKSRAEWERRQRFLQWLRKWRDDVQSFFDAEKSFVQEWLDAEQGCIRQWRIAELDAKHAFEGQVFGAIYDRCGNSDFAMTQARAAWDAYHTGRRSTALADIIVAIAAMPLDKFPEPDIAGDNLAESDDDVAESDDDVAESGPIVINRGAVTSENDRSPCAQVFQVPQVLEEARAATPSGYAGALEEQTTPIPTPAAVGRPTTGAAGCACDADGVVRCADPDWDHQIMLTRLDEWGEPTDEVKPFRCRHSRQANIEALRRAIGSGEWDANTTGYAEIDGPDDYEEIGEMFAVDGIMDGARSHESITRLGHSE